ncbi:MAG: transglutaminaseTgpA domain-containing protein [Acidimicrobiales bacterium]
MVGIGVGQRSEPDGSLGTRVGGHALACRASGIVAGCLALVTVPIGSTERIAVLTAVAIGVALAAVNPPHGRLATRAAGLAILVVALVPPEGPISVVALAALVVLGAASSDHVGMARIVPAAGLPIATLTLRTGAALNLTLLVAWLVVVACTLALGATAPAPRSRQQLGRLDGAGPNRFPRRQLLAAAAVVVIGVPVSLKVADTIDATLPPIVVAARMGDATGPALMPHPGLSGGLDTGQPVELSDEVVLRVRADRPRYWRGTTYEIWDGRRWTSDLQPTRLVWSGNGVRLPASSDGDAPVDADLPEPITLTQQFTTERAGLDVLVGAWRIDSLYAMVDRAGVGSDGSIRLETPLGAGAAWTVRSEYVPATEADLRRSDPILASGGTATFARYASEDSVSDATADLASDITADASTTYDKVRAIEAWMDRNLTYTRDIATLPADADAVDHLLFESKRGFCEQIGSALVVMLRSLGIPARLVVGYVPSEYDATSGAWISRASDAHAWAEVYFPGVGWRGFDPTAGVPTAVDEAPADELRPGSGFGRPEAWVVGGLLVVAVPAIRFRHRFGIAALVAARRRLSSFWRRDERSYDPIVDLHRRLDACGTKLELEWPPTMTVRDRAGSLVEHGIDPAIAEDVVRALERATFGIESDERPGAALDAAQAAVAAVETHVRHRVIRDTHWHPVGVRR